MYVDDTSVMPTDTLTAVITGGYLERALEHYKRAEKHGVKKATMHIRNVS